MHQQALQKILIIISQKQDPGFNKVVIITQWGQVLYSQTQKSKGVILCFVNWDANENYFLTKKGAIYTLGIGKFFHMVELDLRPYRGHMTENKFFKYTCSSLR